MGQKQIGMAFPLLKKVETFQKHHKLRFDEFNYFLPPKHCALVTDNNFYCACLENKHGSKISVSKNLVSFE